MMLVSPTKARGLTLVLRFIAGDSTITSVKSSMGEFVSWAEAGALATVVVFAVSHPSTGGELFFPFFADRGCSDTGDALRLLCLRVMHEDSFSRL